MRIAVPKEIKTLEARIALLPSACAELVKQGHELFIENCAGLASGFNDQSYTDVGCTITQSAAETYSAGQIIVKVKEPQASEVELLTKEHILFSYLHLAAEPELLISLQQSGVTAIGFETVSVNGLLPLLAPMSDIAGRIAVQTGTTLLQKQNGGSGILLGGLAGAERGNVVILGAGVAGYHAAIVAQGLGCNVIVFDPNRNKLEAVRALGPNVTGLHAIQHDIEHYVKQADLLIGAVLIPGAKAPSLVNEAIVKEMKAGSVIIDISVDQGGCIETTRPTTYAEPTFILHDVVHFGVTNMPGAVPKSASQVLSSALLPFVLRLAADDWQQDKELAGGVNVQAGRIVLPALTS